MKVVLARMCQLEDIQDTYWRDTLHDCLITYCLAHETKYA